MLDVLLGVGSLIAVEVVAGNYALAVKARDKLSPVTARVVAQTMTWAMTGVGLVLGSLINLAREEPPPAGWWVADCMFLAAILALGLAWLRLGRWPIRVLVVPMVTGLPWDPYDYSEPENRPRR